VETTSLLIGGKGLNAGLNSIPVEVSITIQAVVNLTEDVNIAEI
jgi:2-phospho-L-lactate transferase/gluconeogenesis factor (CofD/UPF0052 family)